MRSFHALSVTVLAVGALWLPAPAIAAAETYAFTRVNVISMNPELPKKVRRRQTVIVEDGRITAIGKARKLEVPEGAIEIDGRKKFLLPGLADMHVHSFNVPSLPEFDFSDLFSIYFANGVTTVYDVWGFKQLFKLDRKIEKGKLLGPRFYFTSPGVNNSTHATADAVERSVRQWAGDGYEWIKTHSSISEEKFHRLHAVARELGVPVVGHALRPDHPIQATLEENQLMLTHIEEILSTSLDGPENFQERLEEPLRDLANSRIWITSVVFSYEIVAKTVDDETFAELLAAPELRYFPQAARDAWEHENRYRQPGFPDDPAQWFFALDVMLYIADQLRQLSALDRLLLGTDAGGVPLILPGFSIHDELRLLVRGGLTPFEAIQTGTCNAAAYFGTLDEAGTVEVGKHADLILVRKNPLRNVGNLKNLAGVMVRGVWLPQAELDAGLEELAERFAD